MPFLSPAVVALGGGCTPGVVETALTSLRDGTVNVADNAVNAFFESQFGVLANNGTEEEGGNDLFVHP